jgi:hypothetical protein
MKFKEFKLLVLLSSRESRPEAEYYEIRVIKK